MIPRRAAALAQSPSRFVSRFTVCQLQRRTVTTETEPRSTALAQELPPLPSSSLGTGSSSSTNADSQLKSAVLGPANRRSGLSSTASEAADDTPLTKLEEYQLIKAAREKTNKIGGLVEDHYKPHELITNPPSPKDITLELLLASGAHLGHATALWNPGNQRYIFGIRQGIHLISLDIIAAHLRRAAKIVHGISRNGGLILFVGTRDGQERAIVEAARRTKGFHITERWVPGTITNKEQLLGEQQLRILNRLDEEIPLNTEQKEKLAKMLAKKGDLDGEEGRQTTVKVTPAEVGAVRPDLVVCMNPLENQTMLQECAQYRIPTIGIVDTDCDPTCVTYPIPANDDSLRCVQMIAGILGKAGQEGRLERYELEKLRREELYKRRQQQEEMKMRKEEALRQAVREQEAENAASEARQRELNQV